MIASGILILTSLFLQGCAHQSGVFKANPQIYAPRISQEKIDKFEKMEEQEINDWCKRKCENNKRSVSTSKNNKCSRCKIHNEDKKKKKNEN